MMTVLTFLVFAGVSAISAYAILGTVLPYRARIVDALAGRPLHLAPLAPLARAERRLAVRRWAATSPAPRRPMRRAAA